MTGVSLPAASSCAFGPLEVSYDERVLVPRTWTLLQSTWAVELALTAPPGPLLELCAGAGHIGLAAAVGSGRALVQVEADEIAAGYARRNAITAAHVRPVDVRNATMSTALAPDELFPIVVADPPYLPTADIGRWPDDPVRAIDGGPDGLDVVRECLSVAGSHLIAGGALLLQVAGDEQARRVGALVAEPAVPAFVHEQTRRHDAERAVVLLRRTS